jgi:hypothetical protein
MTSWRWAAVTGQAEVLPPEMGGWGSQVTFLCAHHMHTHRSGVRSWSCALTYTHDDKGRVLPAGQQQEMDQVVGDEAEAEDHAAPLLETLACGESRLSASVS